MKWRMNVYQTLAMVEVQREHMVYFGNWVVQTQRLCFSYLRCHCVNKHNIKYKYKFIISIHGYLNVTILMFSCIVYNINTMQIKQLAITAADENSCVSLY